MKKTTTADPQRKLHSGHFAFMRAVAQGLDERASWDRYLRLEGDHADRRTVKRTIAWIRDEFAAAARREHRPGTARLILLDTDRLPPAKSFPTLAEFAHARGMEDFSEFEQTEAYEAAYPEISRAGQGGQKLSRRARLIDRQLDAIHWLQGLVAQSPRPTDPVSAWIHPSLAARLERADMATLADLVGRINAVGARWWARVPGVGSLKAGRILDWLRSYERVIGLPIGAHVAHSRRQISPAMLASVRPADTAIMPLEKFIVPGGLDGSRGAFRAPHAACLLAADNDQEAIGAWLAAKGKDPRERPAVVTLSATQRSYRREAERLLMWAVLERNKALSSLSEEDIAIYQRFLQAPPSTWCGPRHHQRWSSLWRPLEGPLTTVALRQSMIILRSLFAFLGSNRYLTRDPFATLVLPLAPTQPQGARRSFSIEQWRQIEKCLCERVSTEPARRLSRAMRWLYASGSRLSELASATCADLTRPRCDGTADPDWHLCIAGRAGRRRRVPVPAALVRELGEELARHGLDPQVDGELNRHVPILARFETVKDQPKAWSASGFYQAMKRFLAHVSNGMNEDDASRLRQATTHWLRHTSGQHVLNEPYERG